jgi:hypothetical protein
VRLRELAHARSGDKGSTADITVVAFDPSDYELLCAQVTPERVRDYFAGLGVTAVERFEVAHLSGLKFVLHGALGAGVTASLDLDAHGKSLGSSLLAMDL